LPFGYLRYNLPDLLVKYGILSDLHFDSVDCARLEIFNVLLKISSPTLFSRRY